MEFNRQNNVMLPLHADVLDIGGGSGEKANRYIQDQNPSTLTLLDIASVAVEIANSRFRERSQDDQNYIAYQANLSDISRVNGMLQSRRFGVIMDLLAMQFLNTNELREQLKSLHKHSIPGETLFLHQSMTPRFNLPNPNVSTVASLTDNQYGLYKDKFDELFLETFYMRNGGQQSRMAILRAKS